MLPDKPITALLPHRPPWLLIDRLISVEGFTVTAEKRVSSGDPLVGSAGFAGPLVVEALAQTAACLMGALNEGASEHRGYLVAARGWKFPDFAQCGETVTLIASRRSVLGRLHSFEGTARVGDRLIASGAMTFAVVIES